MKNVVFSHYGTTLDTRRKGTASKPESWRPNVGLLSQPDFRVSRLHLFYSTLFHPGLESVLRDMKEVSPETEIVLEPYEDTNPWSFEENYARLYDYARNMKFDTQNESYYVHLATGTHATQICLFLLTEARFFPVKNG